MKETELKDLLKQSIKSPSPDFTNKVMDTIIMKEQTVRSLNRKVFVIVLLCVTITLLSFIFKIPEINYLNFSIRISPVVRIVLSSFFVLFVFSQLFELYEKIKLLNNEISFLSE